MTSTRTDRQGAERRGRWAESWAVLILRLQGYRILDRRFRCPRGEIDIIAKRGTTLVAVEVKARADQESALESVSARQADRIAAALEVWLANPDRAEQYAAFDIRFDLIGVTGPMRFRHWRDLWRP